MTRIDWRARDEDVARIAAARHGDPFSVLGLHLIEGGVVVRAFVPGAERLEVLKDGRPALSLNGAMASSRASFPAKPAASPTACAPRTWRNLGIRGPLWLRPGAGADGRLSHRGRHPPPALRPDRRSSHHP